MTTYDANITSYKTISILGQCFEGMALVHLSKHIPSGSLVALKKFDMDKIKEDGYMVENEIILTRQLQHPNIIQYHIAFVHDSEVCVVSPLMEFGSCRDLLTRHFKEGMPEPAVTIIIKDLLEGLNYIHKKGYIHRAIRASHILVSSSGRACLSGLRYACPIVINGRWQRNIHSFPTSTARNLNWLSPELLQQNLQGYNEKSDMYSVGTVICELANGFEPFAGMETTLMLTEKVRGCPLYLLDKTTVPDGSIDNAGDAEISTSVANRKFSNDLHEITALCLPREPYDRPTAAQLLTHPIFRSIHKRFPRLPELLKPALPYSDRVAISSDEMADLDNIERLSQLDLYSCEWDF